MKKRFIILIDFSEYSDSLIKYASGWATQAGAEILLIHQSSVMSMGLIDEEDKASMTKRANDEALEQLKDLKAELIPDGIEVTYYVSPSHLRNTLAEFLAQEDYDNIVFVGLKGSGLLKKLFLGSVTLDIIDHTENIVVALPKEISHYSHERLYIAVTEKYPLNILGLNQLLRFILPEETQLIFFYIAKPGEETARISDLFNELSEQYSAKYKTSFEIYEGENPFSDIKTVINNRIEEILIIQKGSRLLTDQLFRKYLVNELVFEGQTPLIVLP